MKEVLAYSSRINKGLGCNKMIQKDYLKCPICASAFGWGNNGRSLVCSRSHNFDMAKQGYVNFCGGSMGKLYEDKELFRARRNIYGAGFFKGVEEQVSVCLKELFPEDDGVIVEAGCGEGSLLSFLQQENPGNRYIGMDISKEAVKMAAQQNGKISWLVADICKMPIKDESVDCIIDMLTPANYGEFNRILKQGAYIIKIIPNDHYLIELRQKLGLKLYENKEVDKFFFRHFELVWQRQVKYSFACSPSVQEDIYIMTPMSGKDRERGGREKVDSVTMDLSILIGRKG